jgi:hypothetical protein
MTRRYSYDPECARLAAHFFGDMPVSQSDIDDLAQDFQDAAEEALERRKERTDEPVRLRDD